MRNGIWAVAVLVALGATSCGDVCTRIGAATDLLNRKGEGCGGQGKDSYDVAACERGLPKCSPDDVTELNSYAQCLENVPACTSGQELSFGLAKVGCLQPLGRVSLSCLGAMQ